MFKNKIRHTYTLYEKFQSVTITLICIPPQLHAAVLQTHKPQQTAYFYTIFVCVVDFCSAINVINFCVVEKVAKKQTAIERRTKKRRLNLS